MSKINSFLGKIYALIEWEQDKTLSVVPSLKVGGGVCRVGDVSRIQTSAGVFRGLVTATGIYTMY